MDAYRIAFSWAGDDGSPPPGLVFNDRTPPVPAATRIAQWARGYTRWYLRAGGADPGDDGVQVDTEVDPVTGAGTGRVTVGGAEIATFTVTREEAP